MSMIGFILGCEATHYFSDTSPNWNTVDSGIGIARISCWTLILEVSFMLTLIACLKR